MSGLRLGVVWTGALLFFLSFFLLLSALPLHARRLGVSDAALGVVMGAFALTAMALRPWAGWAADRWGRRPVMLAGAAVFLLASLAYTAAAGAASLTLVRLVHGAGMGLYPTAASALLADLAPPRRRGAILGVFGAAGSLAMAVGPLAGVAIAERAGFATLFVVAAALALVGLALTLFVRESLGAPSTARFRLATTLSRPAAYPALVAACLMLTYGVQVAFLPLYAAARGVNPGVFFLIFALVLTAVRGQAGAWSDRIGRPPVAVAGLLLTGAALAAVPAGGGALGLALAGGLYGVGFGLAQPAIMAWCVDRASERERGRAMGTYYTALELGIAVGAMGSGLAVSAVGVVATFLAAAAVALAGAGLALARR